MDSSMGFCDWNSVLKVCVNPGFSVYWEEMVSTPSRLAIHSKFTILSQDKDPELRHTSLF